MESMNPRLWTVGGAAWSGPGGNVVKYLQRVFVVVFTVWIFLFRVRRWIYAFVLNLRRPRYGVRVRHDLPMLTYDGLKLTADHYRPSRAGTYPTILIRSPYGRNRRASIFGGLLAFVAQRFAERGYHVIVQDVRGRFDSEGIFYPYFNEQADGLATLEWLADQPWFDGQVALWGGSYLGIVQWVIAAESPLVKAMVPSITASDLRSILYPDDSVDLGLMLRWPVIFHLLDQYRNLPRMMSLLMLRQTEQAVAPALTHLPLVEDDDIVVGHRVAYFREWLDNSRVSELWQSAAMQMRVQDIAAPAHLIGGWYDFFLRAQLEDYASLKAAGRIPYLTIGPWHHFEVIFSLVEVREGLDWFDAHLKHQFHRLRAAPVRLYVMGADEWRDYASWPPPATPTAYYLQAAGQLRADEPAVFSRPDTYRYDPGDPTPVRGGTLFGADAGPCDNRPLEARADVLTYTSPPLTTPLDVIGHVRARLYVQSSLAHTDFFARLCDVDPAGRSTNLCDGLFRVEPGKGAPQPDGSLCIEVDMWATACRFQPGHRIRLQVSSGAHPRWNRNFGTSDPIGECVELRAAQQTIYHDTEHPSALLLPVAAAP